MALGANAFGREPELIAERPGECLVRPVARLERHRQDVGGTGGERLRGFGQAAAAHVAHRRMAGHRAEGPRHVEAGDAAGVRDLLERDVAREVAFDEPERFSDGIHTSLA
jgi:hypothetical protein